MQRTRDKLAKGLVITNESNDYRFFFFELDNPIIVDEYLRVCDVFEYYHLDYCLHRTGNGLHWISPTLNTVEEWKEIRDSLKEINVDCPQICMRWSPNKYVDEKLVWFANSCRNNNDNNIANSVQLCQLLNQLFKPRVPFKGLVDTDLKFVHYPLHPKKCKCDPCLR